jgi:hypothetical protein
MKKLGFSKEELFGILKESNAIFKERGIRWEKEESILNIS